MTMFPPPPHHHQQQQNLSKQIRYGGCGGRGSGDGRTYLASSGDCVYGHEEYCSVSDQACVGSDLMAEDESRTESNHNEAGSCSKEEELEKDDRGWLQLSIGGHTNTTAAASSSSYHEHLKFDQTTTTSREGGGGGRLIELDLLPPPGNGGGGNSQQHASFRPFNLVQPGPVLRPTIFHSPEFQASPFPANTSNLFFQQHQASTPSSSNTIFPYHLQETNYMAFRTNTPGNIITPSLSFPSVVAAPGSYFARPFHVHSGGGGGGMLLDDAGGPSLDFRVVEPPRRPQSGVWFMLQASTNQAKEPYLPQIPKSYIRIKDGRMTIRLLNKYLVNKLRLNDESEIEITCRGQQLQPFLTLQHVRDNVWRNFTSSTTSPRNQNELILVSTLLPHSSSMPPPPPPPATTTDHLMVLHYGRIA